MTAPGSVAARSAVVTVGAFDGLHRGHRAVLDEVVRLAVGNGVPSVAVSFEPHPAAVLRPELAPPRLTVGPERMELLAQSGVDRALVLRFDWAMALWSPAEFVERVLVGRCGVRHLVIGPDHHFGRDRAGDEAEIRRLGARWGFEVTSVAPVDVAGGPVSSTRIRRLVAAGEFAEAAQCLGRRYSVTAPVVRGEGRGRGIGVPTANLDIPDGKQLPPDGVYAVQVEWGGGVADGVANQGARPTFGDGRRLLEAHLLDFDGNLYGRLIRVSWVARLREVRRFDSVVALREQLERDRLAARTALAAASAAPGFHRV